MSPYACTTHKPRFRWRNGSLKCHFAFWRTPTAARQKPWKHYRGAASAIFSVAYALGHHTTAILKSEGARGGQKATKTCQNLLSSGTGNCVLWKMCSVRGTKNSAVLYSYIKYWQTQMNSEWKNRLSSEKCAMWGVLERGEKWWFSLLFATFSEVIDGVDRID